MASACVSSFSPRISFDNVVSDPKQQQPDPNPSATNNDFIDFEFHLNNDPPASMLPADELFSDGKLVPLHLTRHTLPIIKPKLFRDPELIGSDTFAVSPKAPTCSSRWRELLRLKKLNTTTPKQQPDTTSKPKKKFFNRNDTEREPMLISSRLSLSSTSSSSGEEIARLSLDEHKPNQIPINLNRNPPKIRVSRPVRRAPDMPPPARCASVDSPRMNASGKVVFNGLGRSSSSPSTFNGGPRIKVHRGMERSYSGSVRVTPVLNVPVLNKTGSVFGLFATPKKERNCSRKDRA